MSIMSDMLANGLGMLQTAVGETVSYTPSGSSAVSCTALVTRYRKQLEDRNHTRGVRHEASVIILTTSVASPAAGDTITFDGMTWGVDGVQSKPPGAHTCSAVRWESVDHRGKNKV